MPTTMDNLLDVMNLRPAGVVGVCRTSDGQYLGMAPGDLGYNMFLGSPGQHEGPGRQRSRQIWAEFSADEQHAVKALAANPLDGVAIPLEEFGI